MKINLGGKNKVVLQSGDRIRILTPGGGGYGKKADGADLQSTSTLRNELLHMKVAGSGTALSGNRVDF